MALPSTLDIQKAKPATQNNPSIAFSFMGQIWPTIAKTHQYIKPCVVKHRGHLVNTLLQVIEAPSSDMCL